MPKCSEFECKNCGKCCGPVPILRDERNKIRIYLLKHPEIAKIAQEKPFSEQCVFRDDTNGKCMIYECRPLICQLFRCNSLDWSKTLKRKKISTNDRVLINQRFGNPEFKEDYEKLGTRIRLETIKELLEYMMEIYRR